MTKTPSIGIVRLELRARGIATGTCNGPARVIERVGDDGLGGGRVGCVEDALLGAVAAGAWIMGRRAVGWVLAAE